MRWTCRRRSPAWIFRSGYTGLPFNPAYANYMLRKLRGAETTATSKGLGTMGPQCSFTLGRAAFRAVDAWPPGPSDDHAPLSERRMSRRAAMDVLGGAS
jgi:hypothetical protein